MSDTENNPHVLDLISAYALGALEPDEVDAVERHLMSCAACAAEASRERQVANALLVAPVASAHAHDAPPTLRGRVLDRVRAIQAGDAEPPAAQDGAGGAADGAPRGRRWLRERLRALFGQPADEGASALYQPSGDADLDHILLDLLLDPACAVYSAPGAAEPTAFARLVATPTSATGVLLTSGLKTPARGQTYQVWLLKDGQPLPNALFTTDRRGRGASVVRASGPVLDYDTVAVTPEPAGGSPGPTGPIVLAGALRAE